MLLSAKRAQTDNVAGKENLGGDVELDAHQVAKVYVSRRNPVYRHLINDKYRRKPPPYFILYVQVAGAIQRGCGRLYIDFLPFHALLPPRAAQQRATNLPRQQRNAGRQANTSHSLSMGWGPSPTNRVGANANSQSIMALLARAATGTQNWDHILSAPCTSSPWDFVHLSTCPSP